MLTIDKAILDTNSVICKNIARFDASERGLLSQNVLAQLRNFIEYIMSKIYAGNNDIEPNNYLEKQNAINAIKQRGNLRFLNKFHDLLQKSVSHYTIDEGGSERLMLKYYEYLLKIKILLKNEYNLDILENISDFPLNTDTELNEYYTKIAEQVDIYSNYKNDLDNDRFYIQKIKPFFINQRIYYEHLQLQLIMQVNSIELLHLLILIF